MKKGDNLLSFDISVLFSLGHTLGNLLGAGVASKGVFLFATLDTRETQRSTAILEVANSLFASDKRMCGESISKAKSQGIQVCNQASTESWLAWLRIDAMWHINWTHSWLPCQCHEDWSTEAWKRFDQWQGTHWHSDMHVVSWFSDINQKWACELNRQGISWVTQWTGISIVTISPFFIHCFPLQWFTTFTEHFVCEFLWCDGSWKFSKFLEIHLKRTVVTGAFSVHHLKMFCPSIDWSLSINFLVKCSFETLIHGMNCWFKSASVNDTVNGSSILQFHHHEASQSVWTLSMPLIGQVKTAHSTFVVRVERWFSCLIKQRKWFVSEF